MEDSSRACLLMEIINVLRAEEKAVRKSLFESSEGKMAGIRFGGGCDFAAHGVEIPNELRIAPPRKRRGNFFDTIVAPESAGIAKGRNATFGADAGAGEDKNTIGGRDGEFWHRQYQRESSTLDP